MPCFPCQNGQTRRSGKILHDIINTITLLMVRKKLANTGVSTSELFGKGQSLMCFRGKADNVTVETPNRQIKEYYRMLDIEVPPNVKLNPFMKSVIKLEM